MIPHFLHTYINRKKVLFYLFVWTILNILIDIGMIWTDSSPSPPLLSDVIGHALYSTYAQLRKPNKQAVYMYLWNVELRQLSQIIKYSDCCIFKKFKIVFYRLFRTLFIILSITILRYINIPLVDVPQNVNTNLKCYNLNISNLCIEVNSVMN